MVLALFRKRIEPNRPTVVLGLTDAAYAAALSSHLHALGWRVHVAETSAAIRKLNAKVRPTVVVLATNRLEETGYLTCAKLQRCRHKPRVLLVADETSAGQQTFAAYVGATDCLPAGIGARALAARVQSLETVASG